MEATIQGLYLTAAGMILLFLAMGVLMLCMALLARVFPVREPAPEPARPLAAPPDSEAAPAVQLQDDEGARIAALTAVALAFAERAGAPSGAAATGDQGSPGPWVIIGRQAMMQARRRA